MQRQRIKWSLSKFLELYRAGRTQREISRAFGAGSPQWAWHRVKALGLKRTYPTAKRTCWCGEPVWKVRNGNRRDREGFPALRGTMCEQHFRQANVAKATQWNREHVERRREINRNWKRRRSERIAGGQDRSRAEACGLPGRTGNDRA